MAGFGPADIGAVLSGVGALAQAAAIGFAAWMASNTFAGWRRQKLSERKIEQAERILTATYKVRRALAQVRNPMMWPAEMHAAESFLETQDYWEKVPTDRRKKMVYAQGHYNRLNAVQDERRALDECMPMGRALFGEKVEKAMESLNRQFHMVSIAVESNTWDGNDQEFQRSIIDDLSSSSGRDRPNKMNLLIEDQVNLIEDALLPVLSLEK